MLEYTVHVSASMLVLHAKHYLEIKQLENYFFQKLYSRQQQQQRHQSQKQVKQ